MRIVVTGGSGKGGALVVRDLREHGHDVLNVDQRPDGSAHGEEPGHRPDRPRPGPGRAGRRRRGRPLRGDPGAGAAARGRDLPHQRAVDLQRLPGGRRPQRETRRLGVERDGPRAPVRHPARVRADRRIDRAASGVVVLAVEARRRDDGRRSSPGAAAIGFVGLRISNIMAPEDYAAVPVDWDDARIRKWNLWGYVDARDVAQRGATRARGRRSRAPRWRSSPPPRPS